MTKDIKITNGEALAALPSRRKFMRDAALVTGGLAGILATGIAPATAQSRELKMLTNSHFVPDSSPPARRHSSNSAASVMTHIAS